MGGQKRHFPQMRLRSRRLPGFLVLALSAGLSQLEVGGRSAGSFIAQLLISPADARKASAGSSHAFGPPPAAVQLPAFTPPAHTQAFPPSGNDAGFAAFPHSEPSPPANGHEPSSFSAPAKPIPEEPLSDTAGGRDGDAPHRISRAPTVDEVAAGGWAVTIRPAVTLSKGDRLTAQRPAPASRRDKVAAAPPRAKPRASPAEASNSAKPAPRRLGARPVGELLPPVGSFRSNEVLAINLSAEGFNKVRDGNYQLVERIDLPEFGLTITRLRPPETLDAINGRDRLYDLLPEDGFALNRVYAPYRLSAGRQGAGLSRAAQGGMGCPAERCFGSVLINWRAPLAACARSVKVGVIDTGFDKTHPAFAHLRYEYKEFLPEGSARASSQHGTSVLSLLAGKADGGTPGLIPEASYVIANAFSADAGGQPLSDTAQMLKALHWLKASGVAVVNLSFAGPEDELVHHAVQELAKAGAIVVAAAGNDGPNAPPSYPAAYEEVIAVTAVDRNMAAYRYANRGEHIDIAAPGVDVWTAIPGRREGSQTGTSFAVPYVAAVIAVALPGGAAPGEDALASKRRALAQLQGSIKPLGDHGRDPTFGLGLVQAPASCGASPVAVAAAPAPPAFQPWAGTVRRARAPATPTTTEPLVVGSWVSTVHGVSGEGRAR
jgi:hypothetical protein